MCTFHDGDFYDGDVGDVGVGDGDVGDLRIWCTCFSLCRCKEASS